MIGLLSRFFIHDRLHYSDTTVRKQYGVLAGAVGIFLNLLLFTFKFIAGTLSGAISITADAFNNLSDAFSSILSLIGFHMADKKPDKGHPFGHGRMEYVSGLLISIMIILMGIELGKTSIGRILNPEVPDGSILTLVVLIAAICVKVYMFIYNRGYGKKINSSSMRATALDSLSDSVATTVVLLSVILLKLTGWNLDGYAGLAVSGFILFTGVKSVKETIDPLLGKAPEDEMVEQVFAIVADYKEIIGVHDLIVHDYGPGRCIISFHGEVPEDGDIRDLHDVIDQCERSIEEAIGCEVTIHMDPVSVNNQKVDAVREGICQKIREYNEDISIHDFRMVEGNTHTNIIFDAVVPLDSPLSDEEVELRISEIVISLGDNYIPVIKIDRQYAKWQKKH